MPVDIEKLFSTVYSDVELHSHATLVEEASLRGLGTTGSRNELATLIALNNSSHIKNGTLSLVKTSRRLLEGQKQLEHEAEQLREENKALQEAEQSHLEKEIYRNIDGENSKNDDNDNASTNQLADLMKQLVLMHSSTLKKMDESQQQMAAAIQAKPSELQLVSTPDSAKAFSIYSGDPHDNVRDWIREVERVAHHARWTPSLTLINAISRISGQAYNWHKVQGRQHDTWENWKTAIQKRFNVKMSMAEFVSYHSKRTLLPTETITEFVYAKNAMLEKSPFPLPEDERVSMIIDDVQRYVLSVIIF